MVNKKSLEQGIVEAKRLRLDYEDREGKREEKIIDPYYLIQHKQKNYLIAYSLADKGIRFYKTSRIISCLVLEQSISRTPVTLDQVNFGDYFSKSEVQVLVCRTDLKDSVTAKGFKFAVREYPKKIRLSKMGESTIRSPLEEKVLNKLNRDSTVSKIVFEPFKIPYHFEGKTKNYVPDVLVEYNDGRTSELIEIKVSGDIASPINQAKFNAARQYCMRHSMTFRIMGIESNGRTNYAKGQPKWDKKQKNAKVQTFQQNTYTSIQPSPTPLGIIRPILIPSEQKNIQNKPRKSFMEQIIDFFRS